MGRKSKRIPVVIPTIATIGREILIDVRRQNEMQADTLTEGEAVEYYDNGWRYGHVDKLPMADEPRYGQVRIVHAMTGRVWVEARDVKPLEVN